MTGQKELVLDTRADVTLRQVLDDLESRFGPDFGHRVFRSQHPPRPLQMHTRIFVDSQVQTDEMLDRPLPGGGDGQGSAEVLIYLMPAASGG